MKTVMDRKKLLGIVKHNRQEHAKTYKEAREAYRQKGIELLQKLITKLEAGEDIKPYLNLPIPEDHTEDYDRTIEMLEHDVREQIELEENEFSQYVLDNWAWKQNWLTTTASYIQ
jgi:hypothetical protein